VLGTDFRLEHAADRDIGGYKVALIRVISPDGGTTLFGIDQVSHYIRDMGFVTPPGFHERHYDDFVRLSFSWVQARQVSMFYNEVKANTVCWREVKVGEQIDPALFAPPAAWPETLPQP
jgi:hypothetical protein